MANMATIEAPISQQLQRIAYILTLQNKDLHVLNLFDLCGIASISSSLLNLA